MMKSTALIFIVLSWLGLQSAMAEELFDVKAANEHFNTGLNLYFQQKYPESIAEFETAIQINPDNPQAYYFIGYAYYKNRDFSKANEAFKTAYNLDHTYSPIPGTPARMD
jgi:tetratricopeptide (TPR) repeat protein